MTSAERFLLLGKNSQISTSSVNTDGYIYWIYENMPTEFHKNAENASALLQGLVRGIINTYQEDVTGTKRGVPNLFIFSTNGPTRLLPTIARTNIEQNEIYLRANALFSASRFDPQGPFPISSTGETYGNATEFFELLGAQEAHHAIHPEFISYKQSITSSIEHDVLPGEIAALIWQIAYAQRHDFSQETRRTLQQRLKMANEFLAKQRRGNN